MASLRYVVTALSLVCVAWAGTWSGAVPALKAQGSANPPQAKSVSPEELARLMNAPETKLILVDTREAAEFAVSRIRGARRVDPSTATKAFVQTLGAAAKGATVVFYCTSGGRSAPYAQMAQEELRAAGARSVAVLKGGIIAWANESRPLVDAKGPTPYVHTYDAEMAKQLTRPEFARSQPRT